jgi:hypothetical protein
MKMARQLKTWDLDVRQLRKRPAWAFVLMVLLCMNGCAGMAGVAKNDGPEALRQRVEFLNTARVQQDNRAVYELLWSGYTDVVPLEDYLKRPYLGGITGYALEGLELGEDGLARVELSVSMQIQGYDFHGKKQEQVWIVEDGQWFLKIPPVIKTPFGPVPYTKPKG